MLNISWESPYTIREGFKTKWRREWCIPNEMLNGFFQFWKLNRFKLLADGFTVTKNIRNKKWYLQETKDDPALFRVFQSDIDKKQKQSNSQKIELPKYTLTNVDGLRPWQIDVIAKLISSVKYWGSAIDGSELGTGKSYSACGVARELNVPFVIVCPKPVIHQWKKVIYSHFNLGSKCKGIINYELLIRGRRDSSIASYVLSRSTHKRKFTWKIPKNSLIIWDEAHRLKNWNTRASKTCIEAHKQGYNQLFLSATLASSPLELRTIGTCTKLFKQSEYYTWAYDHGVFNGTWGLEFNNSPIILKQIHHYLFTERGVRLLRDVIPNFPDTEIVVNTYGMDDAETEKIRNIYDEMHKELKLIDKKNNPESSEMAIRIHALQKAELLKVPLFEEMIREGIEANMSVVVFLNFVGSIDALASRLKTNCIYDGRNETTRQKNIELFQGNIERVLITNIAAAREGLNLQDLDGTHPRLTLISPPYSVTKLKQALGRVHRESSKSKSIQKIVYIADTQEEKVVDSVGLKLQNLTLINNGIITDDDLKI